MELLIGVAIAIAFVIWLGSEIQMQDRRREEAERERKRQWEAGAADREAEAAKRAEQAAKVAAWKSAWESSEKPSWAALTLQQRRKMTKMKEEDFPEPYREFELGITRERVYNSLWYVKRRRPRCYLCGQYLPKLRGRGFGHLVHLDHIVPLAEGGTHTRLNVTLVHAECNQKKHAQLTDRLPGERGPLPSDHPLGFAPIDFPPAHLRKRKK